MKLECEEKIERYAKELQKAIVIKEYCKAQVRVIEERICDLQARLEIQNSILRQANTSIRDKK